MVLEDKIFVLQKDETKEPSTAREDNPKPCSAQSLPADVGKIRQARIIRNSPVRVPAGNEWVWCQ